MDSEPRPRAREFAPAGASASKLGGYPTTARRRHHHHHHHHRRYVGKRSLSEIVRGTVLFVCAVAVILAAAFLAISLT